MMEEQQLSLLRNTINEATNAYRHAETIVQARLYNYLVSATILLAAWPGFNTSDTWSAIFHLVISFLGFLLSLLWSILGFRQCKFLDVHMDIIVDLENQLPEDYQNMGMKTTVPINNLQKGLLVNLRNSDKNIKLNKFEKMFSSRNFLFIVPIGFKVTFLFLLVYSFLHITEPKQPITNLKASTSCSVTAPKSTPQSMKE